MSRRIPFALLLAAATLLVVGGAFGARKKAERKVAFDGVLVRDQDSATMEKGLLRTEPRVLRGFRSREALWVLVAPSRAAWERDVAPGLAEALDKPPADFKTFASFLPASIGRAGPHVAGGLLHVELPGGRGRGLVAFHLPPLINEGREGTGLLNSGTPNLGQWISGVDVSTASDSAEHPVTSFYMPGWPGPLGRSGPPTVPMRPLPKGGSGSFVLFGGQVAEGDQGGELRESLWDYATEDELPLGPMETFPRRLDSLGQMLRSVRLEGEALDTAEGAYATLSQAPGNWTWQSRAVRHPTRYLSLAAPVTVAMPGQSGGDVHSAVVGIVAFYSPLVMNIEEAPLWLGVDAERFASAVHRGEIPFLRDGEDVLFYRGHLARWMRREVRETSGKGETPEAAAELARSWGERYRLRGLERASRGLLPQRFAPIPEKERAELVDERLVARGLVDKDDLAAWLRHFEPKLKPGDLDPSWTLSFSVTAAELPVEFSLEAPWQPEPERTASTAGSAAVADQWGARGSGGGGGAAATADLSSGGGGGATGAAWSGDLSLQLLDLYSADTVCRMGSEATVAVEFDLGGVPEGSAAKLRVEWDLLRDGRSVQRDAWNLERGSGSHEVEFAVPCPDEEGVAELYLALLAPGHDDLLTDSEMPLDVKPPGGRSWSPLRMPEPKACQAAVGGEGASDEDGFSMGGSVGLSGDQVSSAVRGFQRQTLRCRDGRVASGTVILDVTVGCDGRVSAVEVLSDETGSDGFADCVARVFAYAPFPAHDMPDGANFGLPLRYE
jgi:hypothetical protein